MDEPSLVGSFPGVWGAKLRLQAREFEAQESCKLEQS